MLNCVRRQAISICTIVSIAVPFAKHSWKVTTSPSQRVCVVEQATKTKSIQRIAITAKQNKRISPLSQPAMRVFLCRLCGMCCCCCWYVWLHSVFFFLFRNVYSYYLLFSLAVQHNRWRVRAFTVKNSCSYYHSLCRHRFSIRSQAMMVTIYSTRVKCLCLLVFGFGFGFGFSVSLLAKSETYTRRISSNWILCCVALLSVCFHSFIH